MNKAHLDKEEDGKGDEAGPHVGKLDGGDVGEESVPDLDEAATRICHAKQTLQLGRYHLG